MYWYSTSSLLPSSTIVAATIWCGSNPFTRVTTSFSNLLVSTFLRSVGAGFSAWPSRNWTLSTSRILAGFAPVWFSAAMNATPVPQSAKIIEP